MYTYVCIYIRIHVYIYIYIMYICNYVYYVTTWLESSLLYKLHVILRYDTVGSGCPDLPLPQRM